MTRTGNELWTQMAADCLGRTVERTATTEATSIGAAICAGVGAGAYADMAEGARALAALREPVEPSTSRREAYEAAYQTWLAHRRIPKV